VFGSLSRLEYLYISTLVLADPVFPLLQHLFSDANTNSRSLRMLTVVLHISSAENDVHFFPFGSDFNRYAAERAALLPMAPIQNLRRFESRTPPSRIPTIHESRRSWDSLGAASRPDLLTINPDSIYAGMLYLE
jgi:hypothetical protein